MQYILPVDNDLNRATLWHNDTHVDNIFVDPNNPADITAITDWQCAEITPLFEYARQPGFLDHDGISAEGINKIKEPTWPANFEELDLNGKAAAHNLWVAQNPEAYYGTFIQKWSKSLDKVCEFRKT